METKQLIATVIFFIAVKNCNKYYYFRHIYILLQALQA
jgi:hypothetical protein